MHDHTRYASIAAGLLAALILAGCVTTGRPAPLLDAPLDVARAEPDALDLRWFDATLLTIEGRGWSGEGPPYARVPDRARPLVTPAVWNLSRHAAGIAVRFVTDSPVIAAQWDGGGAMPHMPATGVSGLDLYRRDESGWEFVANGRPKPEWTTVTLTHEGPTRPTEYLLYLPLYHAVNRVLIGVGREARIAPAAARDTKPIVFYGTSITQGGCASRPGMAHVAILGRWLDRETINWGFSGSGRMEPAMADLLAELDVAVYVLDCLPNMTTEMVQERVVPFVQKLRAARPDTPILLVENCLLAEAHPSNAALRAAYAELRRQKIRNLHYLPGKDLLAGPENATVDTVHPTDLGFLCMAQTMRPVLQRLLRED